MIITSPVKFDDGTTFFPDGQSHSWAKINGYDSAGCRITNIVGHDGSDYLKKCPYCNQIFHAVDYGPAGRYTNGPRDQSRCIPHRNYN